MRRFLRWISAVPAFFLFSLILMLLWNSLVAGHLGWASRLSYLQTAGLWFLVSVALAGAGIGVRCGLRAPRRHRRSTWNERKIEFHSSGRESDDEREEIEDRIERNIKRGLARWVDASENAEWSELGALIERKIKRKISDWVD